MAKVVGVKFKNTIKTYYFSPANENDSYIDGDYVIVETAKGIEYGTVVFGMKDVSEAEITHPLKPILRKADEKDIKTIREQAEKIPEAMDFANERIRESGLDMKLIGAEFAFDGSKLTYFFSAEKRVDFRELVKTLAGHFHTRIELRQVGIRDETKLLGGISPCGRECCCASFLNDFGKVSIKMAKNQGLHLNPAKISGLCGRLMCCLEYENEYYAEVYGKMPKVGGTVKTPEGEGIVVSNDMLKLISKVKISKGEGSEVYKDFPIDRLSFKRKQDNAKDIDDETDEITPCNHDCENCENRENHEKTQENREKQAAPQDGEPVKKNKKHKRRKHKNKNGANNANGEKISETQGKN